MEGLWIIFLIIGIVSKIMEKKKRSGKYNTSRPKMPKADLDVSAKRFFEQLTENFEELAEEKEKTVKHSTPASFEQEIPVTLVEGECIQDVHMKTSTEGTGMEGKPSDSEGVSTEGAYAKGSMAYQDTRSTLMEGSAHPLAAEVDFRAARKTAEPKGTPGAPAMKRTSHSVWAKRIIWKEILSEPVALRKRHG